MSGIAAIFAYHTVAPKIDKEELRLICGHMSSRGPDGSGEWISTSGRVGLADCRLATMGSPESRTESISDEDKSISIVFDGEIYNREALRDEMVRRGHRFGSSSITELLIRLYEDRGEAMLSELRGMFGIALWDGRMNSLLLARDPYGIKPLYYADDGWSVRIASQVKALQAGGHTSRLSEPAGITGFYLFGSVPEPFTLYQEIRSVPAGSLVWVNRFGASAPKSYFSIAKIFRDAREQGTRTLAPEEAQEELRSALLDSVRHHLRDNGSVGAFLSGGDASGALVRLAREAGCADLRTVTLTFPEYMNTDDDESERAGAVARRHGTLHTVREVPQSEFQRDFQAILGAMDQPSIDGINVYYASKCAAELGLKTAFAGLGSDELFGGYSSFDDVPRWVRLAAVPGRVPGLGRLVRRATPSSFWNASPKAAGLVEYGATYPGAYLLKRGLFMPWELPSVLEKELAEEGLRRLNPLNRIASVLDPDPGTSYSRVATLEASYYMRNQLLRDADWASMAHSLEIRVPFVDVGLLRKAAPLLSAMSLSSIRQVLTQGTPGPTAGFNIPMGKWFEQNRSFDLWRKVPALNHQGTHWAKRWAYSLGNFGLF